MCPLQRENGSKYTKGLFLDIGQQTMRSYDPEEKQVR